jgi:hypothetical protein
MDVVRMDSRLEKTVGHIYGGPYFSLAAVRENLVDAG